LKHVTNAGLIAVALLTGGCGTSRVEPRKVLGVKKDAQGKVLQEIVGRLHVEKWGVLPGPHGLGPADTKLWYECWLSEPGKPNRPLPFLTSVLFNPNHCRPVADTSYWVIRTQKNDAHGETIGLVVFDESGILRQQILDYAHDWSKGGGFQIYSRDGNRKLIVRTPRGFIEYDVISGSEKPGKEPPRIAEDDEP